MQFFIRTHSTEPLLKMAVVEDGRGFNRNDFQERLLRSSITFSMKDERGQYKIFRKPAGIVSRIPTSEINEEVYYIYYPWDSEDVNEPGTYEGEFRIRFFGADGKVESTLLAPIRERLIIHVL